MKRSGSRVGPGTEGGSRRGRWGAACTALPALLLAAGCTVNVRQVQDPPRSAITTTGATWMSMIYVARLDTGVLVIDLGWDGDGDALRHALSRIGAATADVRAVFLTHSHRDHIAAWPWVRDAPFYLGAREVPFLVGERTHGGLVPGTLDPMWPPALPAPGELDLRPFASDTAFAFGSDTVRAYLVPGHTEGSAAYLFRGIVFAGDALSYTAGFGFTHTKGVFTADMDRSRASLRRLWQRVAPLDPAWFCTAHAKCAPAGPDLERDVFGEMVDGAPAGSAGKARP